MMSTGGPGSARAGRTRAEKSSAKPLPADTSGSNDKQRAHTHTALKPEDRLLEEKISQVVQLTGKTKDEAEIALFDCDYDPTRAINMLLEGEGEGEWVEKTRKKKVHKPTVVDSCPAENVSRAEEGGDRERYGTRGGPPPRQRRGAAQDRSWKAHERRENEKNAADCGGEERRWVGRGGARSGRGGRRGGMGSRSFQSRRVAHDWDGDSWSASTSRGSAQPPGGAGDALFAVVDDWDSEDWDGSLSDTKVFVPSATAQPPTASILAEEPEPDPVAPPASFDRDAPSSDDITASSAPVTTATNGPAALPQLVSAASAAATESSASFSYSTAAARTPQQPQPRQSAAVQYPSGYTEPPGLYPNSGYTPDGLGSHMQPSVASSSQPAVQPTAPTRTKVQRPRAATNPKIPESAVEMPGDTVSSLGVKFGRLDFGAADTILSASTAASENTTDAYLSGAASPRGEVTKPQLPASPAADVSKNTLESSLGQYPSPPATSAAAAPTPTASAVAAPPAGFPASASSAAGGSLYPVSQKSASSSTSTAPSGVGTTFSQLAASYVAAQAQSQQQQTGGYGGSAAPSGAAPYSAAASVGFSSAATAGPAATAAGYGSSNPTAHQPSSAASFSAAPATSATYNGSESYTTASGSSATTYSAPAAAFNGTSYHNGGSAYTGSAAPGLSGISLQEKLTNALSSAVKQSQYDPTASSSSLPLTTPGAGPARAATTRSGPVPSVPPGVPMQYFVGQTPGVPFYTGMQQMYSYEDMQAIQRLPHMQQQAAAGSGQGRADATSSLGGAFSMSDAKFSRQEAASPVQQSSQLGQQSQQQQQQFFNPAAGIPPNYTYFPFVPQYSIYTPVPPASNAAHQAAATSAAQYPKPLAYTAAAAAAGSAFSSYDPLGSGALPTPDYKSPTAPFVGAAGAGHKLGGSAAAGGADLYGKMAALGGKFDNKGFHAATPPPYGLAGGAGAPGGYAPHLFIQPMPPQHALLHPGHGETVTAAAQQRQTAPANKPTVKPNYAAGYWPGN